MGNGPLQNVPGNAIPVVLTKADFSEFYNATGGGGSTPAGPGGTPLTYYQLTTTLSGAVPLPTIPALASYCMLTAEVADLRWRADGTAPTASVGMPLYAGAPLFVVGQTAMAAFHVIQQSAGGVLNVSYFE
jgi:hypothetical protein